MSGPSEHYAQCGCFCGCNEMCGPSMVPLRGHVECQRCLDGECVNEHYEKTHSLESMSGHSGEMLKTAEDTLKKFDSAFQRLFRPDGAKEFQGSRAVQQYRRDFKDR
jgi:hypothetical protein